MSLSILLSGAGGRMGRAITEISKDHGCTVTYPIDLGDDPSIGVKDCDAVIDFSLKSATLPLPNYLRRREAHYHWYNRSRFRRKSENRGFFSKHSNGKGRKFFDRCKFIILFNGNCRPSLIRIQNLILRLLNVSSSQERCT